MMGALGVLLLVGGCGGAEGREADRAALGSVPAAEEAAAPAPDVVRVVTVLDGDTFTVSDGRTVRVLGIDSCELDTGAGREARTDAQALLPVGRSVTLRAEPGVDRDPYSRHLRYVTTPTGSDLGTAMIVEPHTGVYEGGDAAPSYVAGLRRADGGPRVCDTPTAAPTTTPAPNTPAPNTPAPRTAAPRTAAPATTRSAPAPQPAPRTAPAPEPEPEREPEPVRESSGCHPSYTPCVPDGPDLDCKQIGFAVIVTGPDEFRLDGDDNDGKGCESYG
ncbi:thermonuclease family protein [Pseudonocardia oceani]|uniref:thermonuclease family protein n=1 Tax=Pseudonocardia oceani TaxID=2792013 RepID=UPI001CF6A836|nr:thermonuclease family protein [Pseudonocardia oceani]